MANRYRNLIYSTAEYTHTYRNFRGIERSASSITGSPSRLAYSQNMYKDYDGDGSDVLESIPGFRCFAFYGRKIHAIYYQRSPFGREDHLLVHVGDKIMRHPISDIRSANATGVEIATVRDGKSFGFEYGRCFYIMDTEKLLQINDEGVCKEVGTNGALPYVPTVYVSGEAYEQRNLLSDDFKEEYYVADPSAYLYANDGLTYSVTDPNNRYCSVCGIEDFNGGEIYVPAYVSIAGIQHKVVTVEANAFSNNALITALYLPEGIISIGAYAFSGCSSLNTVVTPSTLVRIDDNAFLECGALSTLYLGAALNHIGKDAFKNCGSLSAVDYALGQSELEAVSGSEIIVARSIRYHSEYEPIKIALPIHDKALSIKTVEIDGKSTVWDTNSKDGAVSSVNVQFSKASDATGIKVSVTGTLAPLGEEWSREMNALNSSTPYEAIVNCTTAEVFDGRIFFSGNPSLPNTVFYTERPKQGQDDALYVGKYNYFNDGVGSYKVTSMLAVRNMLAVFKEGDDGSGSIFYHTAEGVSLGDIDTVYPVAYVHSGICSAGSCLSFLDDPVFLTGEGLMALNHENINYQRNVVCRSHNVNYSLLKEDLSKAHMCEWLGYLAVGVNGKIFLADSRAIFTHATGSREYEWFMLTDIGAYRNDLRVYRYAADSYADTVAHPTLVGEAADSRSVYSVTDESGINYYYTENDGVKYSVIPTEEFSGGEFSAATSFMSHGKLLFFSTDLGHLCVFNNDMRGEAPDYLKESPDYSETEYAKAMGDKLHPYYYSFVGHAPKYMLKTPVDDCGVPHLTKNTVKKSLVIKAKATLPDTIRCEVIADAEDSVHVGNLPPASVGFDEFDFSTAPWYVSRYTSVALNENEKRWVEKQIILTAERFASPISVYSISYRYTIKGKIKNNT